MISLRRWWAFAAAVSLTVATRLPAQEDSSYLPSEPSPVMADTTAPAASPANVGTESCGAECKPSWWKRWWGGSRCETSCSSGCATGCTSRCRGCQSREADPKGVRFGDCVHAHGQTQVVNGIAARLVLYHYDFVEGTAQLNQRGKDQAAKIAALAVNNRIPVVNTFPIIVERTPDAPGLDEARRKAVADFLIRTNPPIAAERVVVGVPISIGLSGREAEIAYQNLLNHTRAGGTSVATPGALGGARGGFGISGGSATGAR